MKIYIILECCSGIDYERDYPSYILGVFTNELEAKKTFQEVAQSEIDYCEDDRYEYDTLDCGSHYFELTNFDEDYHLVLRLHEDEIK